MMILSTIKRRGPILFIVSVWLKGQTEQRRIRFVRNSDRGGTRSNPGSRDGDGGSQDQTSTAVVIPASPRLALTSLAPTLTAWRATVGGPPRERREIARDSNSNRSVAAPADATANDACATRGSRLLPNLPRTLDAIHL